MTAGKMSNDEQRAQHEKVSAIDMKVSDLLRIGKIVIPLLLSLIGAVIWVGVKAVAINDWNKSLVKQDQMARHELRETRADSTLNAKIDTNNFNVNQRIDKLPKLRFTKVIQRNGKDIEVN